jgi:hypothetical protein
MSEILSSYSHSSVTPMNISQVMISHALVCKIHVLCHTTRLCGTVIQREGWKVDQVSFITGARSVDKQDFRKNLKFFGVPEASISSIYSKLAMRTFDGYANILKCMYSTRFNGGATGSEASTDSQLTPCVDTSLTHPINTLPHPDKYKRRKKESPKERDK